MPWEKIVNVDDLTEHTSRTDNPHSVTASQVGAITKVEDDTNPRLGGALDAQDHSIWFTLQSYTGNVGTTTIDWTKGNKAKFVFGTGDETLQFINPDKSCNLTLLVVQDSDLGGRTLFFPESIKWKNGAPPIFSNRPANAVDIVSFFFDGANYYGQVIYSFSPSNGLSSGWQYRKAITIAGTQGSGKDYQILLKIGQDENATGFDFHLNGHSAKFPTGKNDGGDLRFTAADRITLLPFWVEKVENGTAYVWVRVKDILDIDNIIYCYYGNTNATNASNGKETFFLFDDFDTLDWFPEDSDCGSITDSKLTITNKSRCTYSHLMPSLQGVTNIIVEAKGEDQVLNNDADLHVILRQSNANLDYYATLNQNITTTIAKGPSDQTNFTWHEDGNFSNTTTPKNGILQFITSGQILKAKWIGNETVESPTHTDDTFYLHSIDKIVLGIKSGSADTITYDWVRIRKYNAVNGEPTFQGIGEEEKIN